MAVRALAADASLVSTLREARAARPPPAVPPVKELEARDKVAPLLLVMFRTLLVAVGSATGVVVTETPEMPLA